LQKYAEDFAAVLFQTIVTDKITVEHKYLSAVLSMPGALAYPLFEGVEEVHRFNRDHELDRGSFLDARGPILEGESIQRLRLIARSGLTSSSVVWQYLSVIRIERRLGRYPQAFHLPLHQPSRLGIGQQRAGSRGTLFHIDVLADYHLEHRSKQSHTQAIISRIYRYHHPRLPSFDRAIHDSIRCTRLETLCIHVASISGMYRPLASVSRMQESTFRPRPHRIDCAGSHPVLRRWMVMVGRVSSSTGTGIMANKGSSSTIHSALALCSRAGHDLNAADYSGLLSMAHNGRSSPKESHVCLRVK
jgi:hypothetical protein